MPLTERRRPWPLVVRRALAADREAVLEFATNTWDGWDYIPHAWDEWLEAADGVLLVGLPGSSAGGRETIVDAGGRPLPPDRPIAVARVAMLSRTEAWLEGIRVHPQVRGMDVATDLQLAELHIARTLGASVLRYATGSRNEGSHRLGARHGIELLASFRTLRWSASGVDEDDDEEATGFDPVARRTATETRRALLARLGERGLVLGTEAVAQAWDRLSDDATFLAGQRLYEYRAWALQELTAVAFTAHLAQGEVVALTPGSADGWALAVLPRQALPAEDVSVHLALLAGDTAAAVHLAAEIQRLCGTPVRFRIPVGGALEEAPFDEAGFLRREGALDILGRPLTTTDGPLMPALDGNRLVLLADTDPSKRIGR